MKFNCYHEQSPETGTPRCRSYSQPAVHVAAVDLPSTPEDDNSLCPDVLGQKPPLATTYSKNKCFYCGGASHHRRKCPAREAM